MTKLFLFLTFLFTITESFAQSDQIVLKDLTWDKTAPAGMLELDITSNGSRLAGGIMYTPNGNEKHPTLILLHGLPGNEKNLDIAQVVRAHGWNVIYFNYRGSWGSEGKYSFENCVQDVKAVVDYCNKNQDYLKIDTTKIALFGHSLGGFVCLKVLEQIPQIKKGFALSAATLYQNMESIPDEKTLIADVNKLFPTNNVAINTTNQQMFLDAYRNLPYYNISADTKLLKDRQIIMLDEHNENKSLADAIKVSGIEYFNYQVWDTDHGFTNKRISLMNLLISFLDK
jgi:pimeloyl-ACP methyl ester carboxylesterase